MRRCSDAVAVEPGGRGDAERVVGGCHRPVGGDHSSSGGRRGVVADLARRPQPRLGAASRRSAGGVAGGRDVVWAVGVAAGRARPPPRKWWSRRRCGGRSRRRPRCCQRCSRRWIPMPVPGNLSVFLDAETTRMLLGEVPAAFHAGIHDILLIAFGLALAEFVGTGGAPIVYRRGGPWASGGAGLPMLTCRARWGGSPPSIRCRWRWVGCPGRRCTAGEAGLGAVVKDAKEQLRALPDGWTYGVLRYLNSRCRSGRVGSADRV